MTAGYYTAAAFPQFANPGEIYICDDCMWADPRYRAVCGSASAGSPNPPSARPRCHCRCHGAAGVEMADPIGDVLSCRLCTGDHTRARLNITAVNDNHADGSTYMAPRPWNPKREKED